MEPDHSIHWSPGGVKPLTLSSRMSRTSTNGVSVLGLDEPLGVWIPNSRTKSRWKNLFTCGAPLDSAVKAIFTAGLLLAWLSILSGTDALIREVSCTYSEFGTH